MHTRLPRRAELRRLAWWRSAVIYQVYVRSFADANGDGIGDLVGVRTRLDYLRELGVGALWLNPFYPSPQADAGYDVADYRDVARHTVVLASLPLCGDGRLPGATAVWYDRR